MFELWWGLVADFSTRILIGFVGLYSDCAGCCFGLAGRCCFVVIV